MTGPAQAVITNDWMTYGVTVTNAGPNDAPNVMLTNTLPTGRDCSDFPDEPVTRPRQQFDFQPGHAGERRLHEFAIFTVEPTNAGALTFSASVGASGMPDTNTANNFASTNITVTNYLSGPLVAITNSSAGLQSAKWLGGTVHYRDEHRHQYVHRRARRRDRFDQSPVQRRRHEQRQSVCVLQRRRWRRTRA